MSTATIPFSVPYRAPNEERYLREVLESGHVHGDGLFTKRATAALCSIAGGGPALLTASGTDALEMASLLLDLGPGDEVIVPSFTFSSGAAAIALFGATPVFADSEPRTMGIDPESLPRLLTTRTRAISVMNYAGVGVEWDAVQAFADEHGLAVINDNAHGLGATYRGRNLSTFGDIAIHSFHDTKNVHSGEGGAAVINNPAFVERAEIVREKGTNRSQFMLGRVDKYTWVDKGSSYLMSELSAAVLTAQLEAFDRIQERRQDIWARYAAELVGWSFEAGIRLMSVPADREHPAHAFYMFLPTAEARAEFLSDMKANGVVATFHYVPLDNSPAGLRFGWTPLECAVAHDLSSRLVRLPLWASMTNEMVTRVIETAELYHPSDQR